MLGVVIVLLDVVILLSIVIIFIQLEREKKINKIICSDCYLEFGGNIEDSYVVCQRKAC